MFVVIRKYDFVFNNYQLKCYYCNNYYYLFRNTHHWRFKQLEIRLRTESSAI